MPTIEVRFWSKVRRGEPNECWLWIAACDTDGYGTIKVRGVQCVASRVAWMLHTGAHELPPRSVHVMHSCDNPPCVNPAHLSIGTHAQNVADMVKKNRQARGSQLPQAKVNEDIVRAIKARLASGEKPMAISAALGVGERIVRRVRNGRSWKHVT